MVTMIAATASLLFRRDPSPAEQPTRSATVSSFPRRSIHDSSKSRSPGHRSRNQAAAHPPRSEIDDPNPARRPRGLPPSPSASAAPSRIPPAHHNRSPLRIMETLPTALADLRAKVSDISVQAHRLDRRMETAITNQAPDIRTAREIRRNASR